MSTQILPAHKVRDQHTRLLAYIYVRQSSPRQVRENSGSTEVQMSMRDHALGYGWPPGNIIVVQADQGRSARTTDGRDGFKAMLKDIVSGRVGAVFSAHSSRLVRSGRDSQHLLTCCEIAGTLIIDQDGVYDLNNENDRFFLGIKGIFDEVDRRRIVNMLADSRLALARKGQYRMLLPPGYVWECVGRTEEGGDLWAIRIDPDPRVQQFIRNVFDLFELHGSARAVARHLNESGEKFPVRSREKGRAERYVWKPVSIEQLLTTYRNPTYAGSYVFGKSALRQEVSLGDTPSVTSRWVDVDPRDWKVHLRDNHEGYITWEQHERIKRRLESNGYDFKKARQGAPRSGRALLQGIVRCGTCRRPMVIFYRRRQVHYYSCVYGSQRYGDRVCCTIPGVQVDKIIEEMIIQAFEPAQVDMSLEAAKHAEARARESLRRLEASIKAATSAAEYADYRYMQVDPKNLEVKARREEDLQEKLLELKKLKDKHAEQERTTPRPLDSSEHKAVLALASDISSIWHSEKMTNVRRKQITRAIIERVELVRQGQRVDITTYWQTGACTRHYLTIRQPGNPTKAAPRVYELIRELVTDHTDEEIADRLNAEGLRSKFGKSFTKESVKALRQYHNIPTLHYECSQTRKGTVERRGDGRYSIPGAARALAVSKVMVRQWCERGFFDALRPKKRGYSWWIRLSQEEIDQHLPLALIKNIG